jgi:hypothetical protein
MTMLNRLRQILAGKQIIHSVPSEQAPDATKPPLDQGNSRMKVGETAIAVIQRQS